MLVTSAAAAAASASPLLSEQQQQQQEQELRDSDSKADAPESETDQALKRLIETMEQLEVACGGDYTFIGDNIDFLVKVVGSSKAKRNKLYHWFHLIGSFLLPLLCLAR